MFLIFRKKIFFYISRHFVSTDIDRQNNITKGISPKLSSGRDINCEAALPNHHPQRRKPIMSNELDRRILSKEKR
jgi:hypothetical protein